MEMDKAFDAAAAEKRWYEDWEKSGTFQPSATGAGRPYCITIPPPNVTGSLHMGHALCYTIQDILGRWRRMCGDDVLILPGVDHAGIATQNVVEKEIAAEGLSRHDLGREQFLERVWNWKERYGARIIHQLQRLGCAFDWSRQRFTMDDAYADAILDEFIRLFDKGLIYRGARVINWCPRCRTALSDIEVEYVERDTFLWHIRYDFDDGRGGSVTVATTRPETMLGDTAVAVNPADERYADMRGRMLRLPLTDRDIPLIFDDYASLELGTGAVKVTPAHDLNDYEAGRRHKLPQIVVIGEDGRMTAAAGDRYAGLTREEARERVEADLDAGGYLVGKEPYRHSVGACERCHTVIEPLLSEQWFVKMGGTELAQRAVAVVAQDRIAFAPERYKAIYLNWMDNIRDWCISRQLWWGHRIPIYYAPDGRYTAARSAAEAAQKLGLTPPGLGDAGQSLRQDEDVLDTWFSSALWPFATLGWPQSSADLARFYPTSVLVTSREILFLWVARMIMTGLEFMDEIPFHEVYIYATVLDKQGRRMSKSLGNGIDPIEMIDKYGADALRFSLVRLASKGQDIKFSEERIPEARNFCTKIWNAARFVLMNLEGFDTNKPAPDFATLSVPERWILTRLQQTAAKMNDALASYDMDDACAAIYEFFWNDYCDWFVEFAKPALRPPTSSLAGDSSLATVNGSALLSSSLPVPREKGPGEAGELDSRASVQWTLVSVLDSALRLMHPIMPFLTEEIRQYLPVATGGTVMRAPYPQPDSALVDEAAAAQMETIITAIRAVRNTRAEMKLPPSQQLDVIVVGDKQNRELIERNEATLRGLARVNPLKFADAAPTGESIVALPIAAGLDFYLSVEGAVDKDKERARIDSDLAAVEKDIALLSGKLSNPKFVERAAPEIVAKDRAALADRMERKAKLESRKAAIGG